MGMFDSVLQYFLLLYTQIAIEFFIYIKKTLYLFKSVLDRGKEIEERKVDSLKQEK